MCIRVFFRKGYKGFIIYLIGFMIIIIIIIIIKSYDVLFLRLVFKVRYSRTDVYEIRGWLFLIIF